MSDVFISYAREDRSLAEALAKDLQGKGFSVWWDAELVASDNFQDVILAALSRAKAAIVIWTKNAVTSNFVRDEARYALFHKKLVATKVADLDVIDIPFGFQSQHTEDIQSRDNITRAIEKLGVQATAKPGSTAESWEQVRSARNAETLLAWIGGNPSHPSHTEAIALMGELLKEPNAPKRIASSSEPIIRRSRLEAFFRGLTFQLPRFQLSVEGRWSAIGLTLTLWAVFISAIYIWVMAVRGEYVLYSPDWMLKAMMLHALLSFILSYIAVTKWAEQRNFIAVSITSPIFIVSCVGVIIFSRAIIAHLVWNDVSLTESSAVLGLLVACLLLWWKVTRLR
jgi:TIR domain